MQELMVRPTILQFKTCKDFAKALEIGAGDLIITNQYIYEPYFQALDLKCDLLFQEKIRCRRTVR